MQLILLARSNLKCNLSLAASFLRLLVMQLSSPRILIFTLYFTTLSTLSGCQRNEDVLHDQQRNENDRKAKINLATKINSTAAKKVTKIIDGDSFQVTDDNGEVLTVNLKKIDAPEKEQPFGRESTKHLKEKLLNKTISFSDTNEVLFEGINLNVHLLKMGYVWLAPGEESLDKEMPDKETAVQKSFQLQFAYEEAQTEAMNNLRGIWHLEHELRVPPWIWREQSTQRSASYRQPKNAMNQQSTMNQPNANQQIRVMEAQKKQQTTEQREKHLEKMAELQRQHLLKQNAIGKKTSSDDQ